MPNYSIEDFEELQTKSQNIIAKLEQLDVSEWQKKKDLIEEYIIVNRTLRDAGKLDVVKKDFCTFIVSKLTERNITVNQNGNFYRMFNDDEKDARGPKSIDQKSIEISSGRTVGEQFRDKVTSNPRREDDYTRFFDIVSKCIDEADGLNSAISEEYQKDDILLYPSKDKKIIKTDVHWKTIQENIDIEKLTPEFLAIHATLRLARDNLDERNEWGNYQKMILQFLIRIGETKAQAAKMSNYCSKYASLGIERNEKVKEYWDYLRKCPNCEADIAHECNYQIQLIESGKELSIKTPLDGY